MTSPQPSTALTTGSHKPVRDIVAQIEAVQPGPFCALVPASECRAVIDGAEKLPTTTAPEDASAMARTMIGVYPRADVIDATAYTTAIAGMLAMYPPHVSRRIADPLNGLPSRLKFLPRIAEVKDALEEEKRRQTTIVARAKWMVQEHERREKERLDVPPKRTMQAEEVDQLIADIVGKKTVGQPSGAA